MANSTEQPRNICRICGFPQKVVGKEKSFICERCGSKNKVYSPRSERLTLTFALTALIFYVPANIFPFMTLELYGSRHSATVWGGVTALIDKGHWPIGLVVFLASMVVPLLKLAILFYLALTAKSGKHTKLKTRLYLIVEVIGRWSMLDIFLLAVLVAVVKLGSWTDVQPEPGSILFALVVIFTMAASAYFKPEVLWENHKEQKDG